MNKILVTTFAILAGTGFMFTTTAAVAAAKCDALPNVEWWSKSHTKVVDTVDKRYQGDWKKYIGRWHAYRKSMQRLYNNNSVAVVKSRGIKLRGKQLESHIKNIDERIAVLNCLAKSTDIMDAKKFDEFSTAAGGETPKAAPRTKSIQVASITGNQLDIEVTAKCVKDTAEFQITNLGGKWPRLGEINIYKVNNKALLSKRRVKMGNSQQATFRIRKKGGGSYGAIGLWVSPSWDKRPFKYDATITCG